MRAVLRRLDDGSGDGWWHCGDCGWRLAFLVRAGVTDPTYLARYGGFPALGTAYDRTPRDGVYWPTAEARRRAAQGRAPRPRRTNRAGDIVFELPAKVRCALCGAENDLQAPSDVVA